MPDKRRHRGPGPADAKIFAAKAIEALRGAVADFSLLLTKGYAEKSALKLVGDKFSLTQRQRQAIMRNACSEMQLSRRRGRCIALSETAGRAVTIDGYNVLITIESAMSGGCIFKGRDGTFKDLASVHGTYRKVAETVPALELTGSFLQEHNISDCKWLLDSPVSNSGRLKTLIAEIAEKNNWQWDIQLLINPDTELMKTDRVVASSDSVVLDNCKQWVNLAKEIIKQKIPDAWLIDLS